MSAQLTTPVRTTASRLITGATRHPPAVVVSAGRMQKTVKVRMLNQTWNAKLRKYFRTHTTALVHDPTSAVRAGDIIQMAASRHSKHVKHIVAGIVSPFGEALEQREGQVLSKEERQAVRDEKRRKKVERRAERGVESAVQEAVRRKWAVPDAELRKFEEAQDVARVARMAGRVGGGKRVAKEVEKGRKNESGVDEAMGKVTEDVGGIRLQE